MTGRSSADSGLSPSPVAPATAAAIGAVYRLYDPPVWVVTAADGDRRGGLVATFVVRASIVSGLPRMVVGIAKHHHTWRLIEASDGFVLHLLSTDQLDLIWRFGLESGHKRDKLAGLPQEITPSGQPRLTDALAWLDCRIEGRLDSGDRTIYLAAVEAGGAAASAPVLTVQGLYQGAPPERRAALDRLYARDGDLDAAAILAWRAAQTARSTGAPPD